MAQIDSLATGPGNISMIKVASNSTGKQFDISGDPTAKSSAWPIELLYYESIFQDVVHASVTYVDTGDNQQLGNKPAVVGLPITGSESVKLKFEDVSGEKLEVELLVNKVTEVLSDAGKSLVTLEMNSKELFDNDKVRINTRFDGAVSDHVKKILEDEDYIGTKKTLDIEETLGTYNKICNNKKPFYMMNWFSTIAAPEGKGGESAGFLLWETSKGFHFKSIDWLFDANKNPKKKSILYTETPDGGTLETPAGYDMKA